jgi:hypothetical protein
MTATLVKLAFSGMRSRLLASALTILLSSAAAATIVLALEVGATARDPWQRTFDAAHGAHVIATAPSEADARGIGALPGVAERTPTVPSATATATITPGDTEPLDVSGLRPPVRIDAPVRTAGSPLHEGGIVLERSLADALGLTTGTKLRFAAPDGPVELTVIGTAVSPGQPRYPRQNPGAAWVTLPRSSGSSRIAAAGDGPRPSALPTPRPPRPSPSGQRRPWRRWRRGWPSSVRGSNSARKRCAMRSRSRSS